MCLNEKVQVKGDLIDIYRRIGRLLEKKLDEVIEVELETELSVMYLFLSEYFRSR